MVTRTAHFGCLSRFRPILSRNVHISQATYILLGSWQMLHECRTVFVRRLCWTRRNATAGSTFAHAPVNRTQLRLCSTRLDFAHPALLSLHQSAHAVRCECQPATCVRP